MTSGMGSNTSQFISVMKNDKIINLEFLQNCGADNLFSFLRLINNV
jgi:hypothetical protein